MLVRDVVARLGARLVAGLVHQEDPLVSEDADGPAGEEDEPRPVHLEGRLDLAEEAMRGNLVPDDGADGGRVPVEVGGVADEHHPQVGHLARRVPEDPVGEHDPVDASTHDDDDDILRGEPLERGTIYQWIVGMRLQGRAILLQKRGDLGRHPRGVAGLARLGTGFGIAFSLGPVRGCRLGVSATNPESARPLSLPRSR
ncbi:hypothetical protein VTK73DRAFT_1218 [Phialemonium thermophilum]|uniref:Uncharacterized protein n=1 Tax=Phialemonium thermophilum TaxID=223376 RepID=A0ABR3VTR5_9PEZI